MECPAKNTTFSDEVESRSAGVRSCRWSVSPGGGGEGSSGSSSASSSASPFLNFLVFFNNPMSPPWAKNSAYI